jgi:hypothetical protein
MDANTIIFTIISVAIIAFNIHVLYKSHKELKRSREELKRLKEAMLKELNKSYQEAKAAKDEDK